jgi:tetratricopeptide (TPR) repeat protein
MRKAINRALFLVVAMMTVAILSPAQSLVLDLPFQSQQAEVSQRIGLTDITVRYHRPLVKDRKIWNSVVPYGKVWRAGANENTTIAFSDPVVIEGKPLDRGTYGLHMIPTAEEWTIIFSKNSTSWGSFTYDQSEDALRVNVKPKAAETHDALTYEFADLRLDSAIVELEWEKIAVPFKVAVDIHSVVEASLKKQLRGLSQTSWMSWNDAAGYLLTEKLNLTEALTYADKSIQMEDRYDNEITKSRILTALNRKDDATVAQKRALDLATPFEIHSYARQLLSEKRTQEAFAIFHQNALKHPDQWFVHTGLARMYSAQGKFEDAAREMKIAVLASPDDQKSYLDGLVRQLEAKQDINR